MDSMGQGKSRTAEGINGRMADRTSNDMRKERSIFRSEHQFRLKFKAGGGIMPTTAQEIYIQVVRTLSLTERLRLATLILNELSQPNFAVVEPCDT
jgi:hypothetical protein